LCRWSSWRSRGGTASVSTVEGNSITHDDQIAKMALIVETVEEVWG
jgi:hypothetical protein